MRKTFINVARKIDYAISFTIIVSLFSYFILGVFNTPELKQAIKHSGGIEGVYELTVFGIFLIMLLFSFILAKQLQLSFLSLVREIFFKIGDVVLFKESRTKKIYAASIVNCSSKASSIYVTSNGRDVIEVSTSDILRVLDN